MVKYKTKARAYHKAVSRYDKATVIKMVRRNYIQHNPMVPTGRAAFVAFLPKLKEHRTKIVNIRMISDGPYICMHHIWKNATPFGGEEMAAFHIIRFDGKGLIAEHWNVMTAMIRRNPSGRSLVDGPVKIREKENTVANKNLIGELFAGLIRSEPLKYASVMRGFFKPTFRQHHAAIKDGITGYRAAIKGGALKITYKKLHRIFGEGNLILAVSEGRQNRKPTAFYDLFRMEKDKIAEHWSIYQEIPTKGLANSNTMFNFT